MYLTALIVVLLCQFAYIPDIHGLDVKFILEQPLVVPSIDVLATSLLLTLEPGDNGIPAHYHSGPLVGYVIEGDFLFQLNDEPPRIISAGNAFYEKYHDNHVWGANASNTTICKVFATVYGRPGEELTTFTKGYQRESYDEAVSKARARLAGP